MKPNNFADAMNAVHPNKVNSVLKGFEKALKERESFEAQKKKPAFIELEAAKQQMLGNRILARFFAVMDTDPVAYLNRERKRGYRTNLKTIRKVRMLAEYMGGHHGAINGVCKALFAATILAAIKGKPWTSNHDAESLLFGHVSMSQEYLQAFHDFYGLNIKSPEEARNQACQFRTAFENLGVFFKSREDEGDLSSTGIYADMNNPLMQALKNRWGL